MLLLNKIILGDDNMSINHGEILIFEITRELTAFNKLINKDILIRKLSKVISNYQVEKLNTINNIDDLKEKIEMFITSKKLDGLSKNTIDSYKLELKVFNKFIHKTTSDIITSDIRVYLGKFNYLKVSSLARKISVLKSFFSWLLQEEIIDKDPTSKIKTPKYNKRNPKFLTIDELEMLREGCVTLRERALVECLYASATRLNELHNMNISDIDNQTFSVKVIGKGNKEREVFFSLKAIHHLRRYLESREDDCEALFVTERKPYRRLSNRGIQREINKIASRTDIKKKVTPHVLRHSFSTLALNNNMEIAVLSSILGHSNISTTQIYAHVTDENKKYQYKKHMVI